MIRAIFHACVATLGMWMSSASAQDYYDADNRGLDLRDHFQRDWGEHEHFGRGDHGRGDQIDQFLERSSDPLRSNFDTRQQFGDYGRSNDGVQNYGSPNYFNQYFGTNAYGGDSFFPGQWYYQNRRYVSPGGGLYRYPSDRFYTR